MCSESWEYESTGNCRQSWFLLALSSAPVFDMRRVPHLWTTPTNREPAGMAELCVDQRGKSVMGLEKKTEGNPAFKAQTANGSLNPGGRPKGALSKKTHPQVKERLLGKWKTHPVDKLVELANF